MAARPEPEALQYSVAISPFVRGVENLVPDNSKGPCSWPAAVLLIDDLISQGTRVDLEAAQCTAVQYDTYTRPSVASALGVQNVVLPPTGVKASYQRVALLLAPREERVSTKTGKFDDSILVGTVNPDRSFVSNLVMQLAVDGKSGKRLAFFPNLWKGTKQPSRMLLVGAASPS